MRWFGGLLLAAAGITGLGMTGLGVLGAATARAEDDKKVDCADTRMKFDVAGYDVTCADLSRSSISVTEAVAATKTAKLDAYSSADMTFLDVIDERVIGSRIFMYRHSMQEDVQNYFSGSPFKNWASDTSVNGFEVASFTTKTDTGDDLNCIGFRRQGARRYEGIAGIVVGIACSAQGREHTYDALKHLQAPGG